MRMVTLQRVEHVAGGIICRLLDLVAGFLPKSDHVVPSAVRKVLVIKYWGIGSLIQAAPLLQGIRKLFPNAEIHLATLAGNQAAVKMLAEVDAAHFVDLGNSLFSAVVGYARSLVQIWRTGYDVVFDTEFYTKTSAIASFCSMAPVRVGYHSHFVRRGTIHNRLVPFNVYRHVSCNFLNLLTAFGASPARRPAVPTLNINPASADQARQALKRLALADRPYVIVNVNAGELAYERRWPADRYAELASRLCAQYDVAALFIGLESERAYVENVVSSVRATGASVWNIAGEVDLECLAELMRGAALTITNDSGPMHLASAVGAPVVAFFGPETPVQYGPVGPGHVVLFADLPCSPCINVEHGKRIICRYATCRCQEATTVEDVLKRIRDAYGGRLPARPPLASGGACSSPEASRIDVPP